MGRGKHKQKKAMRRQKLVRKGYSGQAIRIGVLKKEIEERQRAQRRRAHGSFWG